MIRVAGRSFETLPHWRRLLDDEFSSHIEITNILIEVPELADPSASRVHLDWQSPK
jgi:hypothetical protein